MMDDYSLEIKYYEEKENYFRNLGFYNLAEDFHKIVEILKNITNKGES